MVPISHSTCGAPFIRTPHPKSASTSVVAAEAVDVERRRLSGLMSKWTTPFEARYRDACNRSAVKHNMSPSGIVAPSISKKAPNDGPMSGIISIEIWELLGKHATPCAHISTGGKERSPVNEPVMSNSSCPPSDWILQAAEATNRRCIELPSSKRALRTTVPKPPSPNGSRGSNCHASPFTIVRSDGQGEKRTWSCSLAREQAQRRATDALET